MNSIMSRLSHARRSFEEDAAAARLSVGLSSAVWQQLMHQPITTLLEGQIILGDCAECLLMWRELFDKYTSVWNRYLRPLLSLPAEEQCKLPSFYSSLVDRSAALLHKTRE